MYLGPTNGCFEARWLVLWGEKKCFEPSSHEKPAIKWVWINTYIDPFLVGWTSINPSYFDVNYRGLIGFDPPPSHDQSAPKTMWTYFRTGREWRPPKSPKIPMHWRTRSWLFRPCMAKYEGHHRFTILIHFNSRYSVSLKNKKLHVLEFFQYHDMTFNDCNKDIYFLFTDVCSISKPCSVCMWHQGATRCFVSPPGSVGSRSSYLRRDLLAISASSEVRGFERNTRYDEIQNLYTKKIKTIESMKILDLVRSKW